MKVLGTSQVSTGNKITLVARVVKKLDAKYGDLIIFEEDEKGRIYIKKG